MYKAKTLFSCCFLHILIIGIYNLESKLSARHCIFLDSVPNATLPYLKNDHLSKPSISLDKFDIVLWMYITSEGKGLNILKTLEDLSNYAISSK